jgi:hypothetical protein
MDDKITMNDKAIFCLVLLHCPLWLLIAATFDMLVLEMTYVEIPIAGMLAAGFCMALLALVCGVVPWTTLVLFLSLILHLWCVISICRLDPQRTAKAEFSVRLGIPATDARVAAAFDFLSAHGRSEVKTTQDLVALLKRAEERAKREQKRSESEQKERAENALFRKRL